MSESQPRQTPPPPCAKLEPPMLRKKCSETGCKFDRAIKDLLHPTSQSVRTQQLSSESRHAALFRSQQLKSRRGRDVCHLNLRPNGHGAAVCALPPSKPDSLLARLEEKICPRALTAPPRNILCAEYQTLTPPLTESLAARARPEQQDASARHANSQKAPAHEGASHLPARPFVPLRYTSSRS